MPVSVIEIKHSFGWKGISSSAAGCYRGLPGASLSTVSAVTRAMPTSCAAWDFSRETTVEVIGLASGKARLSPAESMFYLSVDPSFDRLREDPRFADLLRRIGFRTTGKANLKVEL